MRYFFAFSQEFLHFHRFSPCQFDSFCYNVALVIFGWILGEKRESNMKKSSSFSGSLGFVLAAAGSAVGVSNIGPIAEQLDLLLKLTGGKKDVGVLYNPAEDNSLFQVEVLRERARELGVSVREVAVTSVNDIQQAVASLKGKVGGLYLPTDNIIASAVPVLMKSVFEAGIPTVAGEGGMVRAGILASIAVDYYTLGKKTGAMGADILDGKKKPADMPIQSQKAEKVLVNLKTAETMGIQIPEDILKTAETVK